MSLGLALAVCLLAATPSSALTPSNASLLETLRLEAARDPAPLPRAESARSNAGGSFDGDSSGLPVTVRVLEPVEFLDPPGTPPRSTRVLAPVPVPRQSGPAAPEGDLQPTYHFQPHPSPLGGLTVYTPVRDAAGRENSTRKPSGGGWRSWIKPGLLLGGAAATIGGLFFPPLLFLGGLLLGGGLALSLFS